MNKELRKVKLGDLDSLAEMLVEFWQSQFVHPSDSDILEDIRRMLDSKGIGRLILADGAVSGFIYVNEKYGYLNNIEYLYVKKEFRSKGLASFAIKEIQKIVLSKDNDRVQIEVSPFNTKALRLYHRLGFTNIDTITLTTHLPGKTKEMDFQGLSFQINPVEAFQQQEKEED